MIVMQNSMGAFEAKTHFGQLIERAIQGKETLITRRGKVVAKIVPVITTNLESAKSAAIRLRALAKEMNLGPFDWDEWKNYRDTGRR
jgi:prevent-host-death family protein